MAEKKIKLSLIVDSKTGQASIKKTSTSIKKLGDSGSKAAKKMTVSWKKVTVAVTAFSAAVVASTKGFISAYAKQEQAEKRLAAVIKSTGQSAGFTTDELKKMAVGMQQVTTYGDEIVLSGMAILATYKNIANDAFPRAMMAAMDLSTVLEQDLKSSVVMIAKALNDPIANLGALGRAGVQFTKSQKDVIKSLAESGKQAEAMNIILKELESQQGGVARAAREGTGIWKVLSNVIGDLSEELGKHLHEVLEPYIKKTLEWIKANEDLIKQKMKEYVDKTAASVETLSKWTGILANNIKAISIALGTMVGIKLLAWMAPIITGFIKWVGGTALLAIQMKSLSAFYLVAHGVIVKWAQSLGVGLVAAGKFGAAVMKLGTIFAGLGIGWIIGSWINEFKAVQKAAEHSWNGIFFASKYSVLKIQLSFLQAMEKIKVGWKDLKKWFIDTFPKMAEYMDMEMPIIKDTPKIRVLKNEIIALKEEYRLLEAAINKAYTEVPTLPTVTVTAERITDKPDKGGKKDTGRKDWLDYDAELEKFEQQLTAMSRGVEKFNTDRAVRERTAAEERLAQRTADHELFLQYISTERENALRAINDERDAMLERTTTLEEYIAVMNEASERKRELEESYNDSGKDKADRWGFNARIDLMDKERDKKKRLGKYTEDDEKKDAATTLQLQKEGIRVGLSETAKGLKALATIKGKHAKHAFMAYKAFKIAETLMETYSSATKAYSSLASIPYVGPALGIAAAAAAVAMGMAQVNSIRSQQAPSYDQGGVSNAKGIYQTGNIAEAHIPIPSGGRIPVEMGNQQSNVTTTINVNAGGEFEDAEASRRRGEYLAEVIQEEFARNMVFHQRPGGLLNEF